MHKEMRFPLTLATHFMRSSSFKPLCRKCWLNFLHMEITLRFLLLSLLLSFCHAQQSPTNIDTQIKGSKWPDYAVDSGAANAYAVTNMPLAPALRAGSVIIFKANNANTGASTLTVNGG